MSENFSDSTERCADVIDHACQVEERMRDNDVAMARHRAKPEQVQVPVVDEHGNPAMGTDGHPVLYWPVTECVTCGDDIPEARLALGRVRCIACQTAKEKMERLYGT